MATDVGPVSVRMSASPEGLAAGLATAENMVAASGQKMAAESDKAGSKLAAAITGKLSASGNFLNKTLPEKVRGGVQASYGAIMSLEGTLEKALKDPGRAAVDLVGGIGGQLARIPALGGVLALPFEGVAAAGALALAAYAKGADSIRELGKAAAKTGVAVSDFQVFALVAGDMSLAEKAVFKFQQKLADAQLAAIGTSDAFTRLGLDGRAIAEQAQTSFSGAFGKVADKIRELPSAMLQAKAAFELFGKSGFQLLPAILKGSGEIDKMRANIAKFGGGVNGADVANVKQADLSKKLVGAFVGGFSVEVTKAVAPGLAVLSGLIAENMTGFGGLSLRLVDGFETAGLAVARFVDAWQAGTLWDRMSAGATGFFATVMAGIGELLSRLPNVAKALDAITPTWNLLNPLGGGLGGATGGGLAGPRIREALGTKEANPMADGFAQIAKEMMEKSKKLNDDIAKREAEDAKKRGGKTAAALVSGFTDEWRRRTTEFQKTTGQDLFAGLWPKVEAMMGKRKDPLAEFQNAMKDVAAVKGALFGAGAGQLLGGAVEWFGGIDGALTDVQKALTEIGKGNDLGLGNLAGLADGLNAFPGLVEGAANNAFEALKSQVKLPEVRFAGAMQAGTREAYSLIQAWKANPQLTVEEQMKMILEEQKRLQEEQNRIGREALAAFKKLAPDVAGIGG